MKKLIFISSLVFALLLMFSCNEEQAVNKQGIKKQIGTNNPPPQNSNFINPYDSIGIVHNLILDSFIAKRDSLYQVCDSANFVNKFNEIVSQSTCEIGYKVPDNNCESIIQNELFENQEYFNGTDFNQFIENNIDNQVVKNRIYELLDIFDLYNNLDTIVNKITNWEFQVNEDNNIGQDYKEILLMAGSIARHSSDYWYNVYNDQNNIWHFNNGCTSGLNKKKDDKLLVTGWKKVVSADVGGLIAYSIKAWWTGNPWVIGAAAAATVGVSAATAVAEYWDDITSGIGSALEWLCFWCD